MVSCNQNLVTYDLTSITAQAITNDPSIRFASDDLGSSSGIWNGSAVAPVTFNANPEEDGDGKVNWVRTSPGATGFSWWQTDFNATPGERLEFSFIVAGSGSVQFNIRDLSGNFIAGSGSAYINIPSNIRRMVIGPFNVPVGIQKLRFIISGIDSMDYANLGGVRVVAVPANRTLNRISSGDHLLIHHPDEPIADFPWKGDVKMLYSTYTGIPSLIIPIYNDGLRVPIVEDVSGYLDRLTAPVGSTGLKYLSQDFPVTPGEKLNASAMIYKANANTSAIIGVYDSQNQKYLTVSGSNYIVPPNTPTRINFGDFVVPSNVTSLRFIFAGLDTNDSLYAGGVRITTATTVTALAASRVQTASVPLGEVSVSQLSQSVKKPLR